jgi:hypothetical protein
MIGWLEEGSGGILALHHYRVHLRATAGFTAGGSTTADRLLEPLPGSAGDHGSLPVAVTCA